MSHLEADPLDAWWDGHHEQATEQLIAFVNDDGVSLDGLRVADVGCGDGIIDLGVVNKSTCAELVGFDLNPVDRQLLAERALRHGVPPPDARLQFRRCTDRSLPATDGEFDMVISWSAFEHIRDPMAVAEEMRRILKPDGLLFVQLWPFFASQHGSHLEEWWPDGWVQHRLASEEIATTMRSGTIDPGWIEYKLRAFTELNRIRLDDLQHALRSAGFRICRATILSHTVILPDDLQQVPLSDAMIAGVVLTARPLHEGPVAPADPVPITSSRFTSFVPARVRRTRGWARLAGLRHQLLARHMHARDGG